MNSDWKRKEIWARRGNGFCVEVSRHEVSPDQFQERGVHRWCVYAYLYPPHPHFANFSGNDMWQDSADILPLHSGPSFLRWHRDDDGKPTSVQVGADYNHLHDADYTFYETADDARSVFNDADQLFDWLAERSATEDQKVAT